MARSFGIDGPLAVSRAFRFVGHSPGPQAEFLARAAPSVIFCIFHLRRDFGKAIFQGKTGSSTMEIGLAQFS